MKNNKRIFSLVLLALLLTLSLLAFTGCYTVKSGKMRSVEGTYELTNYSAKVNEIEENGVKLYVVIRSDGTGYYAYTDNDTPLYFAELRCRFTADPEKSGYYSYVELNFTGKSDGWEKLAINARWNKKNLNSNTPRYKGNIFDGTYGIDYYVDVDFTRISRSTNVLHLAENLGVYQPDIMPYGSISFGGVYSYDGVKTEIGEPFYSSYTDPFVYFYMNVDLYNSVAEAWYMLKSDMKPQTAEFAAKLAYENGIHEISLGNLKAPFDTNAPFYGAMKIATVIDIDGVATDAFYCLTLYPGKNVSEIPADIEMKILDYERNKEINE